MIKTRVTILGVLHTYHQSVDVFSLVHLNEALAKIHPDVILVELQISELHKINHDYKLEYGVILPFAKERNIPVVALDPDDELYDQINLPYLDNQRQFAENFPEKSEIFDNYVADLFDFLFNEHWTDLRHTQSSTTHQRFELKHQYQEELMGEAEKLGWMRMNSHYVDQITKQASNWQGQHLLVTIGIEHVYWLEKELSNVAGLQLIRAEDIILRA